MGGRLLAGYGVHSHGLALTGTIAHALAVRSEFGIDVRSVLIPVTEVESIDRVLRHADLSRLDALVLVIESPESPQQGDSRIPPTIRLLEGFWNRLTPGGSITLVMSPPVKGMHVHDIQSHLAAIRERASLLTRAVLLLKRPPAESAATRYAAWGDAIASTVVTGLIDPLATFPVPPRTGESEW